MKLMRIKKSHQLLAAVAFAFFVHLAEKLGKLWLLVFGKQGANLVAGLLPHSLNLWIHNRVHRFVLTLRLIEDRGDLLLLIGIQAHVFDQSFFSLCAPGLGTQDGRFSRIAAMRKRIAQDAAERGAQNKYNRQPQRSLLSNGGFCHFYLSAVLSRKSSCTVLPLLSTSPSVFWALTLAMLACRGCWYSQLAATSSEREARTESRYARRGTAAQVCEILSSSPSRSQMAAITRARK